MNPLLTLVLVLAGLWIVVSATQAFKNSDLSPVNTNVPPVGMEVQAQSTPDNYGIALYLKFKGGNGQETGAAGNVQVEIYEEPYQKPERMVWSKTLHRDGG